MLPTKYSPAALVTRTVLWILIASVFIVQSLHKMAAFRAANLRPSAWLYVQLGLWCVALVFWLYNGWRDWTTRREPTRPGTPTL